MLAKNPFPWGVPWTVQPGVSVPWGPGDVGLGGLRTSSGGVVWLLPLPAVGWGPGVRGVRVGGCSGPNSNLFDIFIRLCFGSVVLSVLRYLFLLLL